MSNAIKSMKGTSKSLPGFLAKNVDLICDWLYEYCALFQKADDAGIDYIKNMEREKRNKLVQDYVDMHVFIELVKKLKNKNEIQNDEANEIDEINELTLNETERTIDEKTF